MLDALFKHLDSTLHVGLIQPNLGQILVCRWIPRRDLDFFLKLGGSQVELSLLSIQYTKIIVGEKGDLRSRWHA